MKKIQVLNYRKNDIRYRKDGVSNFWEIEHNFYRRTTTSAPTNYYSNNSITINTNYMIPQVY